MTVWLASSSFLPQYSLSPSPPLPDSELATQCNNVRIQPGARSHAAEPLKRWKELPPVPEAAVRSCLSARRCGREVAGSQHAELSRELDYNTKHHYQQVSVWGHCGHQLGTLTLYLLASESLGTLRSPVRYLNPLPTSK